MSWKEFTNGSNRCALTVDTGEMGVDSSAYVAAPLCHSKSRNVTLSSKAALVRQS